MSKFIEMSKSEFALEVFGALAGTGKGGKLAETLSAVKTGKAKVGSVKEMELGDSKLSIIIIVIVTDDEIIIIVIY